MHRILIFTFTVIILLITLASIILLGNTHNKISKIKTTLTPPTPTITSFTPFTATFEIYLDGNKIDFSNPKYHNLSKDVFITPQNAEIISIAKEKITWQDFFNTLPPPIMLTSNCLTSSSGKNFCSNSKKKLVFYINKLVSQDPLLEEIHPGEKLSIIYGKLPPSILGASTSATPTVVIKNNK